MKKFNNEHILKLYEVIEDKQKDITFMVLEFCDADLDKVL